MLFTLALLALCAPAPAVAQAAQTPHEMHRLHTDPAAYIAALEDPKRDAYQKPHEVMEALAVREGEIIADIGAGSGYFSVRLAHHVGKAGRVYAVDVSADMIGHLHRRVRDMQKRELPVGPSPVMKIAREDLVAQMEAHGFRVSAEHTFLSYQYFLVFELE